MLALHRILRLTDLEAGGGRAQFVLIGDVDQHDGGSADERLGAGLAADILVRDRLQRVGGRVKPPNPTGPGDVDIDVPGAMPGWGSPPVDVGPIDAVGREQQIKQRRLGNRVGGVTPRRASTFQRLADGDAACRILGGNRAAHDCRESCTRRQKQPA
ncbi:hypothetical protein D3C87_1721350 [compost metagenome]